VALLGLTKCGPTFRYVLCENAKDALTVIECGDLQADSWMSAIQTLATKTGARQLAVAVEAPDCVIQEADVSTLPRLGEKKRSLRLKAIKAGFAATDDIRVRNDEDSRWYFAALRTSVKSEILKAAATAKMTVVRIENAAYAWVRFLDERYQALIDASEPSRVAVLIVGGRRAELRVYDAQDSALSAKIEGTFDEAVQTGFTETLNVAAFVDPNGTFAALPGNVGGYRVRLDDTGAPVAIGKTALEAYSGVLGAQNAAYAVSLGVAFSAVGGSGTTDLLDIDFSLREATDVGELFAPVLARLPHGDVGVVAAAIAIMLLACAFQWSRGAASQWQANSLQAELTSRQADVMKVTSEANDLAQMAKAYADGNAARQSGGVAARRLTAWMKLMPKGATLSSVTYNGEDGSVSVHGDASDADAERTWVLIGQANTTFDQTGRGFSIQPAVGTSPSPGATPTPFPAPAGAVAPALFPLPAQPGSVPVAGGAQ
jgi:hypothetical protein